MGGVHGGGQSAMCTGLKLLAICFRRAGSCHAVGRLPRSLWPSLVSASRPPALTLLRAWSAASLHRGGHPLSPLFRFVRLAWRRPVSLPPRSSLWRQGRDRRRGGCCSPPSLGIFLVADPMAGAVADSRCRPYKGAHHWHFCPRLPCGCRGCGWRCGSSSSARSVGSFFTCRWASTRRLSFPDGWPRSPLGRRRAVAALRARVGAPCTLLGRTSACGGLAWRRW